MFFSKPIRSPNYSTNQIINYMRPILLYVDLLNPQLNKHDRNTLQRAIKVLRMVFKFHPTRYSFVSFAIAWVSEFFYFI